MPKFELYLQEAISEPNCLSVLINCGPKRPVQRLEELQPGHEVFDFARKILDGKLMENHWITTKGEPDGCDLDLRTMIGRNDDERQDFVFCLACIKLPKGTLDPENTCFQTLAPDEQVETGDSFNVVPEGTLPEPDAVVPPPINMDTEGKYTLDDLLGET